VATGSRIVVIAEIIERYVAENPRAADTAAGIASWWLMHQSHRDSPELVQRAIDYLVERGRLKRIQLADGTVVYARSASSPEKD
jgi:hypothetical protein